MLMTFSQSTSATTKVEKSKDDLNQIHERIEKLKKELDSNTEAHADATDALKESEKAISETNRKLYELSLQQKQNRANLQSLEQQKSGLESTIQQQKQLLGAQLYEQYLHGQQSYIQVVLQQQDPGAIARQLQYFAYVSRARAKLIDATQQNLGKVAKLNDQTAVALKEVTDLKANQEKERRELQSQKNERGTLLKKLSAKITAQRGEINKLKRDEKSLSDLVERLARAAAATPPPKRTPRKTDKTDTSKPQAPVGRNDTLPSNAFDGSNFAALKGKLNLPVRGEITNRFGAAREDTGISWKGLFIKSSEGSDVKSVASGRIVFADWLRGFGNLIIVDHGNGYMSLYGNNQALLKKVGDTVSGGDTVAEVGNSGGNDANGVYFELRYQSKPFDPLSWSSIR
ncbi:MAG: murein hydrolase activator EnvC [Methylophilaceae bacterium]